jgi:hypothetical protein
MNILLTLLFGLLINVIHADNGERIFTSVEYLLWKAQTDQSHFALNIPGGIPVEGLVFAPRTITEEQRFKHDSGVRGSVGLFFCDNFDSRLVYTNFNSNPCTFIQGDPLSIVATPLFGLLDFGGNVGDAARSQWCLRFKTLDWEIGNYCYPCGCLEVRPHIGLKVVKIKQSQDVTFLGIPNGLNARVVRTNNFSAVGPRIGVDEKFAVSEYFNLIGRVSGALVYGKFDIATQFFISQGDLSLAPEFVQCKKTIRPTVQTLVGGSFEGWFCNALFEVGAAYEVQYWWNQWNIMPSAAALPAGVANLAGDFMLNGLTAFLSIRF